MIKIFWLVATVLVITLGFLSLTQPFPYGVVYGYALMWVLVLSVVIHHLLVQQDSEDLK